MYRGLVAPSEDASCSGICHDSGHTLVLRCGAQILPENVSDRAPFAAHGHLHRKDMRPVGIRRADDHTTGRAKSPRKAVGFLAGVVVGQWIGLCPSPVEDLRGMRGCGWALGG